MLKTLHVKDIKNEMKEELKNVEYKDLEVMVFKMELT